MADGHYQIGQLEEGRRIGLEALAVLEQLQADQQTQILVISHVGALQERIAHRIDVRKRGGGRSELRVRVAG